MRIAKKDHLDLLLRTYGLNVNEIADAIEWDRNSLSNFFKGKSQLITEQMLKNLSNFFNFSINFFIGDDFYYCVKIDNDKFEKDVYIDFKDYIVLKFKGIIVDEYKNKQIIHRYKDDFLYLFENNHIGRSFANIDLIKSIKSIDPREMIVGPKYDDVGPADIYTLTGYYHINKYRNYRYGDFVSILIDFFCIGGKGVSHNYEYRTLKPKIDYLKATNERVKEIAEEFEDDINSYIERDIESRSEDSEEDDDFDSDDICREDYVGSLTASTLLFPEDYLELINIFINSLI